ncbi:hypothetical protein EV182_003719, partial [Spiromyces aspiralis]
FYKNYLTSPIRNIPGPFLNTFTTLIYLYHIVRGSYHQYTYFLHEKYGPIVRIGPRHISVADYKAAKTILASHDFRKTRGYSIMDIEGVPNMFSTRSSAENRQRRRQIGPAYTSAKLAEMESMIMSNGCIALLRKLRRIWEEEKGRDAGTSLARFNYMKEFHYMAFDVIGDLAFGRSFGILETGDARILEWIESTARAPYVFGLIPFAQRAKFLFKKMRSDVQALANFVTNALDTRRKAIEEGGAGSVRNDVLQMFLDANDPETGEKLTQGQLKSELLIQLFAGTDTISNTLTWTIHLLMHHPVIYRKLVDEIRTRFPPTDQDSDEEGFITYREARDGLPYLGAVLHESMRILPVAGAGMQRVAPPGGISLLDGRYFVPKKYLLSVLVISIHHDPQIWGDVDHSVFYPERFLTTVTDGDGMMRTELSREMQQQLMVFSSGVRICPGRHLAMIQMYTAMTNLLRNFDLVLTERDKPRLMHFGKGKDSIKGCLENNFFITMAPTHPESDCWVSFRPVQAQA